MKSLALAFRGSFRPSLPKELRAWLIGLFLLLGGVCHGDVFQNSNVFQNPTGPLISPTGSQVKPDQFLGARFDFSTPVDVVSVAGQFGNLYGSYFAALVPLNSLTSLPVGNPSAGVPFNAGEVLSYRTFSTIFSDIETVTVPFSIHLEAGAYGVVFGSGLYGTGSTQSGYMPAYATVPGSTGFFWGNNPWRWQDLNNSGQPQIEITTVPEPSISSLFLVTLLTLGIRKAGRRGVRLDHRR